MNTYVNAYEIAPLEDAIKIKYWMMAMSNASEHEWNIASNDSKFRNKLKENSRILVDFALNQRNALALKTIRDVLDLIKTCSLKIRYANPEAQPILRDIASILGAALVNNEANVSYDSRLLAA
jgi:hypothetical protein